MALDLLSLLTAIAFSSAALTITLFVGWLGSRRDTYMLSWALAVALILAGVVVFGALGDTYQPQLHLMSFILTLAGSGFLYAGALQFCGRANAIRQAALLTAGLSAVCIASFAAGFSGMGTIIANLGMALLMALAARQYWLERAQARVSMLANAGLYLIAAITFVLCAVVIAITGDFVLVTRPDNWAEDLNAITVIVGLTGIGALSLNLHQMRWAGFHRRESMTDSLTGLRNRRALFDTIGTVPLAPGTAVIMFDLDHFKSINDQLGHAVGDTVLQSFSRVLASDLRPDDIAARLGGEEFCVVLRDIKGRSAASVAERIRATFEASHVASSRGRAETTVSAGLAISSIDAEPFEALLQRADDALYKAKSAGRNRVYAATLRLIA